MMLCFETIDLKTKGTIMNREFKDKQTSGNSVLQMLVEALESMFIPRKNRRHRRCAA